MFDDAVFKSVNVAALPAVAPLTVKLTVIACGDAEPPAVATADGVKSVPALDGKYVLAAVYVAVGDALIYVGSKIGKSTLVVLINIPVVA